MNEHEDPETEFNHIDNRKNLLSGAEPAGQLSGQICHMEIPADVARIIDTLEQAGFEAFAVGGCVRDTILGGRRVTGILRPRRGRRRSRHCSGGRWTPGSSMER